VDSALQPERIDAPVLPQVERFWSRREEYRVLSELECWGGPLDGQTVRLRPGQYELAVPLLPSAGPRGVRRVAVYCVGKMLLMLRKPGGARTERLQYLLVFAGEEWRVG
jgi:hypothetical protein